MVGMRNETIISMRFVRSKLRKREESHNHHSEAIQQPTQIVSAIEPIAFRQTPSSVWHFPPLPPQPQQNFSAFNNSQVSKDNFLKIIFVMTRVLMNNEK